MERWRMDDTSDRQLHYFSIPGGGIEEGETAEETVVRELHEEMLVEIEPRQKVAEQETDSGIVHEYYLCDLISGEPRLNDESPEARSGDMMNEFAPVWVSLEDLHEIELHDDYKPLRPLIFELADGNIPSEPWQLTVKSV
jgi:ADP-ribose pyrophosphatase YjhB (NUDIX family)